MKQRTRRNGWRAAAGVLAALATAVACGDTSPVGSPPPGGPTDPPGGGSGGNLNVESVLCRADPAAESVSCGPSGAGASGDIIVGNQNVFVTVNSTNVNYDPGTGAFTFDITLRNLIPQPMGTLDALTLAPDPSGIRIFFHEGPTVTAGTGAIDVVEDGTGTFTAAGQPYYQYSTVLEQFEVSAPRNWQLTVPATVGAFTFRLYVNAPVPFPNGYIDVEGNPVVRSGAFRDLTPIVRSPVGLIDSTAVMGPWSSGDPLAAAITADSGVVHGLRAGLATMSITATRTTSGGSFPVAGAMQMTVMPIRRTWTAAAGTTDWHTGANWLPDSVAPVPTDTAVVPPAPAGGVIFPALAANASIGGVEVGDSPATLDLGPFNLDATGDVSTGLNAAVTGTVGRMVLAGTARTVVGVYPRILVSGTYSLDGNVSLNNNLRVQSGRLRTSGFRIRVNNP